jgi:hypothetical protein
MLTPTTRTLYELLVDQAHLLAERLAVTSYVGDGPASRHIPLTLGGNAPVFATVVPTNATQKVYRVTGDTTGRTSHSSAALANSITALGSDQITVGLALNASGVTYDLWTITTGTVTPRSARGRSTFQRRPPER